MKSFRALRHPANLRYFSTFRSAPVDADLFLRKAELVNRAFDHLSAVYKTARRGGRKRFWQLRGRGLSGLKRFSPIRLIPLAPFSPQS
jgi:hypothetical protein